MYYTIANVYYKNVTIKVIHHPKKQYVFLSRLLTRENLSAFRKINVGNSSDILLALAAIFLTFQYLVAWILELTATYCRLS
jgi:hypothetical protein